MKLETRYSVGDHFWMICDQTKMPKEYIVSKVTVCIYTHSIEEYVDGSRFTENVKNVYPSKFDLIKALADS